MGGRMNCLRCSVLEFKADINVSHFQIAASNYHWHIITFLVESGVSYKEIGKFLSIQIHEIHDESQIAYCRNAIQQGIVFRELSNMCILLNQHLGHMPSELVNIITQYSILH